VDVPLAVGPTDPVAQRPGREVAHEQPARQHGEQVVGDRAVGRARGERVQAVQVLADVRPDGVHLARREVVVAAPEARVELEEHRAPVAGVQLEVEVRPAGPADVLQQPAGVLDGDLVVVGEDRCGVADRAGCVLLQEHLTERGVADPRGPVGVGGEDPHAGVVAGDQVLDDEGLAVAGAADPGQQVEQVRARTHDEALALAGEAHLGVGDRARRLGEHGEGQTLGAGVCAARAVHDHRARVGDAELLAEPAEGRLVRQPLQQRALHVGDRQVRAQPVAHPDQQRHQPVGAGQHDRGRAVVGRDAVQHVDEDVGLRHARLEDVVEDLRARHQAGRGGRDHRGGHAVVLVEVPGQAVGADVPAEHDRADVELADHPCASSWVLREPASRTRNRTAAAGAVRCPAPPPGVRGGARG
jgi:hypothetical protein